MKRLVASLALLIAAAPAQALAWGATGHRMVGELAVRSLPPEVPAFLRAPQSALDVGEYSREPDRSKASGKIHDSDRNAAHFLDLGDDGKVFGGPALAELPPTRADYETALRAVAHDSWQAGYLPYAIVDRFQQLTTDFAYWRVLDHAARNPAWRAHRAWFLADKRRREGLLLRDLGELSHFVGDGSQPMHVSIHYNGWGDFPNLAGYTQARIHEPFEGALVRKGVTRAAVAARISPLNLCGCAIEQRVAAYLGATNRQIEPLYALEKAGGLAPGDPRGPDFAAVRLAAGASELRDLVVEAWRASAGRTIGWSPIAVNDVLVGKVDPYPSLYAVD